MISQRSKRKRAVFAPTNTAQGTSEKAQSMYLYSITKNFKCQ